MLEKLIISDASPLIALEDIGQLHLLKQLYKQVIITDVVRDEIQADLPSWIEVTANYDISQFRVLSLELDKGEASAIALALKNPELPIIIDERKGRLVAKRLNLRVTGTIGLLIKAKQKGLLFSGKTVLNQLEDHGFWLSKKLKHQILIKMGEGEE
ncbi:MAG: DUF3368 domain-containing protein [Bacteroidia bacterium]